MWLRTGRVFGEDLGQGSETLIADPTGVSRRREKMTKHLVMCGLRC